MKELQIPIAYDLDSGELFNVEKELHNKDLIYRAQRLYNTEDWDEEEYIMKEQFFPRFNIKKLCCYECEQFLELAVSSNGRAFLRHKIGSDDCEFKNSTPKENKLIIQTYKSKESSEHYNLKCKLGRTLKETTDVSNIIVDSKFLYSKWGKRKPDVLCEFRNVVFVFEFQITEISLRYIINRTKFYKKTLFNNKPIFLIWILDQNNITEVKNEVDGKIELKQSSMAKRIKYLGDHQNFFSYTDTSHDYVKLTCHFKKVFIHDYTLNIHSKWTDKIIELPSLKLNYQNRIAYFYHFENEKQDLRPEQQSRINERKLNELKKEQEYQEQLKRENEERKLLEERKSQFRKMQKTIAKAKKILSSLSFTIKSHLDKAADQEDKIQDVSNINIDKILEIREQQSLLSAFLLNIPLDFFTGIKKLLEEYNLYELIQTITKYQNRPQYLKAMNERKRINKLKTILDNNKIYYEVDNHLFNYLFTKEEYSRKIFYYEKKDKEDLFGITIKLKSYYDKGGNSEYIYLYEFAEEIVQYQEEIDTMERVIRMATDNLEEQKKHLKHALVISLQNFSVTYIDQKKSLDDRNEFLQTLYWKYLELFEKNIPSSFCCHYAPSCSRCNYNQDYDKCVCYTGESIDFCQDFQVV